jgi:hypothetical protein
MTRGRYGLPHARRRAVTTIVPVDLCVLLLEQLPADTPVEKLAVSNIRLHQRNVGFQLEPAANVQREPR